MDALRGPLCPLGDEELDDDLPRLEVGSLGLLGEKDLERERIGLLIGERLRLRLRPMGDLLRGEYARRGERLLGGERLRAGLL